MRGGGGVAPIAAKIVVLFGLRGSQDRALREMRLKMDGSQFAL